MVAKLLSLLAAAKGATVATVVVAAAAVATVGATTPEVQDAIRDAASAVGLHAADQDSECGRGQPAIVAQRNAADKLLRDAYQRNHKALLDIRQSDKDHDNQAVNEVVRKYDDLLRDRLNTALNAIGADTLGREGQNKASESPKTSSSSSSPSASPPTPKPTCIPAPSGATGSSGSTGSTGATGASGATGAGAASPSPKEEGRVTVANRTTLDPAIKTIVERAVADMDALVGKAKADLAKLPPTEHGKPSDQPGNKPEDKGGGKPSENPGNKPSPKPTK